MNPLSLNHAAQAAHHHEMGYSFSQMDHAVEKAVLEALDLLRKARWSGAEIRAWVKQAEEEMNQKMTELRLAQPEEPLLQKIRKIDAWEIELRKFIQNYMLDSQDTMRKMKLLNPPLSTENLRPFLEALEKDRLLTITAIRPLTSTLDQLTRLKDWLREGRSPFSSFSPVS